MHKASILLQASWIISSNGGLIYPHQKAPTFPMMLWELSRTMEGPPGNSGIPGQTLCSRRAFIALEETCEQLLR